VDCASLTADLKFGVPDYLSPEDMAALLSGFRNKRTSSSHTVRKTGKPDDNGSNVEMGAIPPLSSTEFAPGQKAKTIIGPKAANSPSMKFDATGAGGNVDVKSSEIPGGKTIGSHQLTYKNKNGETETYYGLFDRDIDLSGLQNGETITRPFNISDGKICNCRISAPDTVLTCGDYTIDEDGGDIYVHVDRTDSSGGSSYALSVDQTSRNPSATHAQWTLYKYVDGEATLDCRPGVLPVFSLL